MMGLFNIFILIFLVPLPGCARNIRNLPTEISPEESVVVGHIETIPAPNSCFGLPRRNASKPPWYSNTGTLETSIFYIMHSLSLFASMLTIADRINVEISSKITLIGKGNPIRRIGYIIVSWII